MSASAHEDAADAILERLDTSHKVPDRLEQIALGTQCKDLRLITSCT